MRRLLAAAAAVVTTVSVIGAAPSFAAPAKNAACKAPAGAFLVKPGTPVTQTPTTPVGALGGFEEQVGDFVVDLGGLASTTTSTLELTLSWDNPISDYDLVVNGLNELGTDNPEVITVKASHCKKINVAIDLFTGVPVDELTLVAKATPKS